MNFKRLLLCFAISLWVCSLTVHVFALFGIALQEDYPFVYLLHIGIFVVFFPAIILTLIDKGGLKFDSKQSRRERAVKNRKMMVKMIKDSPLWLTLSVAVLFIYGIANFFFFMESSPGAPSIINSEYVLQNHGEILKVITEAEYYKYQANDLRGFSGHWLIFYAVSIFFIYNLTYKKKEIEQVNVSNHTTL